MSDFRIDIRKLQVNEGLSVEDAKLAMKLQHAIRIKDDLSTRILMTMLVQRGYSFE